MDGRGGTDEGRENGKEVAVGLDVVVVLERTNPNDCYLHNSQIDILTYCPCTMFAKFPLNRLINSQLCYDTHNDTTTDRTRWGGNS